MRERLCGSYKYQSDGRKSSEDAEVEREREKTRSWEKNHPMYICMSQTKQESVAVRTDDLRFGPVSAHFPTYVQIASVSSNHPWSLEGNGFGKKKKTTHKKMYVIRSQHL